MTDVLSFSQNVDKPAVIKPSLKTMMWCGSDKMLSEQAVQSAGLET